MSLLTNEREGKVANRREDQPTVSSEELIENIERKVAVESAENFAMKHVDLLTDIRHKYPLDGKGLLFENLSKYRDIDEETKRRVGSLTEKIRQAILHCASSAEERKYAPTVQDLNLINGLKQKRIATEIVEAEKKLHISCQSLQLTVEVFNELNEKILADSDKNDSDSIVNAALVSELTGFVIEYIRGFEIEGFADIERLRNSSLADISANREKINRDREQLKDKHITEEERSAREFEHSDNEKALDIMKEAWDQWLNDNMANVDWVNGIRDLVPTLIARKNTADMRLEIHRGIELLRAIRENTVALRKATTGVGKLTLEPLPSEKVRRLIWGSNV
jgi:hypothetical protein